jgi:hypothetical protein
MDAHQLAGVAAPREAGGSPYLELWFAVPALLDQLAGRNPF